MAMIIKVARDVALTAIDKLSRYSRHMSACTCPVQVCPVFHGFVHSGFVVASSFVRIKLSLLYVEHTTLKLKCTPLSLFRLAVRGLAAHVMFKCSLSFSKRTSHVLVMLVL